MGILSGMLGVVTETVKLPVSMVKDTAKIVTLQDPDSIDSTEQNLESLAEKLDKLID